MIIWINGAFGAGKTHTAFELARRLGGSARVADPELIGSAMHRMVPRAARGDFQDLPEWRTAVLATLRRAEGAAQSGPLIVPMTIVRDDYYDEIIGGLQAGGLELRHYALIASPDTLRRRLRSRRATVLTRLTGGEDTWALSQIDRCVAALAGERYATQLPTDGMSLDAVVEWIAADAGLALALPRLSPGRARLRRAEVALRHIRF